MPFATNQGVRLHYETAGHGDPIVLVHGLMGTGADWRMFGYQDALQNRYRLIMPDVRGCGDSDRFHDRECYRPDLLAGDIAAILDAEGVDKVHYFGYSMGAAIGWFAVIPHILDRCRSLILGGAGGAYPTSASTEYVAQLFKFVLMAVDQGMEAYVTLWERMEGPLPAERRNQMLAVDPRARLALLQALSTWTPVHDLLPSVTVPALTYAGDLDPAYESVRACASHMPAARFITLPGRNHAQALYRSDMALPHISAFLAEIV